MHAVEDVGVAATPLANPAGEIEPMDQLRRGNRGFEHGDVNVLAFPFFLEQ